MAERRRRRRRVLVLLAVLLAVAVGLILNRSGSTAAESRVGLRPAYDVTAVQRRTLALGTTLPGTLGYGASDPIPLRAEGTVTWLPRSGRLIGRGGPLIRVDDRPVILMIGDTPAWRAIGGTPPGGAEAGPISGPDVAELERNLSTLGYGGFTVDDVFTDATAAAVRRWQHDLGLDETGVVDFGRVVFLPEPIRAVVDRGQLGEPVSGAAVRGESARLRATVKATSAALGWAAVGARASVTLPDQRTVPARVTSIGAPADDGSVTVELGLRPTPSTAQSGAVTVTAVVRRAVDVLTVPVTALVALAEGGYGVQLRDGRYVAVTPGLYADGLVQVSGRLAAGTPVRVPR